MATTLAFKAGIDVPMWRPLGVSFSASGSGACLAWDMRNSVDASPFIWDFPSATAMQRYLRANRGWVQLAAITAVGGAFGAGAGAIFCPSHGPAGTVGATHTATAITLAALPNSATVGINQLANRGDGLGFKLRVKDNGAGGTGKTEETYIVANTAGATPVVTLFPALTFTPTAAATYEMLSGRLYLLGAGTTAAGYWMAYDVATEKLSGQLATTNLAATISTDFCAVMLDELYVPTTANPGEGMVLGGATYSNGALKCIQGTAADGTHITGSGMPADLQASEFINYQIRVVEDGTTPTAVGQRRDITAHTGGATGQFTVATWAVTPSSSAKFVVEQNGDLLLWTATNTVTYSYAAGGYAADANWSTAGASGGARQYANPPAAMAAGVQAEACFGLTVDSAHNRRNSHVWWIKGATVYYLDIANGANGTWTASLTFSGTPGTPLASGASSAYDPATNGGKYLYIDHNGTQRYLRFDMLDGVLEPWTFLPFTEGTIIVGGKLAIGLFIDGATKIANLYHLRHTATEFFDIVLQR
jgi:hypothetical protein